MRQMIEHLGFDIEVFGTHSEKHMLTTLHDLVAKGVPRVALAGGDGTVSTAIQVLAQTDTALAVVPFGTANNFAAALHLPQDLPSALRVLNEGEVKEIDLGTACGRYFAESAGVGLFAEGLSIAKADKNIWRSMYAVMRIVLNLRAHRIAITCDGQRLEQPAVFCAAANTFRMGSALAIAPGAKLTDGLLDLVVLGSLRRSELFTYYRAIRSQMHVTLPKVQIIQAREIRIEARRRLPVHCDDKVPCTTPVTVEVVPRALKVLVERL
jgi:diacylglycerol kinase (ATP)